MALYDGVTVRIKSTVTDFDGLPLTSTGTTSATVDLYDPAGNYVFTSQNLIWNSVHSYWYFDWQDALPGTFTAKCSFTGANFIVFDFGTVRVKPPKLVPTGVHTPIVN